MRADLSLTAFFPFFRLPEPDNPLAPLLGWMDRQRQRNALARLDDRLLADVGITRAEAEVEIRRID